MSVNELPVPFRVLVLTGAWCPDHWPDRRKIIYRFYSLIVVTLLFSVNISQIARLLFVRLDSFEEFNDTFNIALSASAINFKFAVTLLYHDRVVNILDMFKKSRCQARDEFERDLRKDYDLYFRKISKRIVGFVVFTGSFNALAPLKEVTGDRPPIFSVLLPYNLTDPTAYGLTYAHHFFSSVILGASSICIDLLMAAFLLDLCYQFDIMCHRIEQLPSKIIEVSGFAVPALERHLLRDVVQHHVHLYNISRAITRTFEGIIICEFYVDALEIGLVVYQFSLGTINVEKQVFYVLYLSCMLGQLFLNCYFGNEVAVKSISIGDAVYHSNWTELSVQWNKDSLMIMKRSSKVITISTRAFVHLMLETFVKIVKASYTGYNIAKTST